MIHKLLALIISASLAFGAAIPLPKMSQEWHVLTGYVPNSSTDLTTTDSYLDKVVLSNITAGAVTVVIKDKSTNCGGSACQIWPTVSMAANTVYTADLGGIYAPGGVQWECSAATSVVGWIKGKYPKN